MQAAGSGLATRRATVFATPWTTRHDTTGRDGLTPPAWGGGFSRHSGRMVRNGAHVAMVMRQGRWASSEMVERYTRKLASAEARAYL